MNLAVLESELLAIARKLPVNKVVKTEHGSKYVMIGSISTPVGQSVTILTVWIIDEGESAPRFVTARPYGKRGVEDTDK